MRMVTDTLVQVNKIDMKFVYFLQYRQNFIESNKTNIEI